MTDKYGIRKKGTREIMGIPLSTESEMGFIFIAILGQTGIVGSIFFVIFLICLFRPIIEYGDPSWIALSLTAFYVNFGETILFSTGGLGAISWLLISFAHVESLRKRKEEA